MTMLTRFQKPTLGLLNVGTRSMMGKKSIMSMLQTRSLATVEPNTPRQQPTPSRRRSTPVSFDTANLTIQVGVRGGFLHE